MTNTQRLNRAEKLILRMIDDVVFGEKGRMELRMSPEAQELRRDLKTEERGT